MRIFTFILAIYIFMLTGIPCCAFEHCEENELKTEVGNESKHPSSPHNEGCSNCSPFFCHTCGGVCLVSNISFSFPNNIPLGNKVFNVYREPYYPQFAPILWQPPDIAEPKSNIFIA